MYSSGPTVRVTRPAPSYPYLKAEPLLAVQEVMWSLRRAWIAGARRGVDDGVQVTCAVAVAFLDLRDPERR